MSAQLAIALLFVIKDHLFDTKLDAHKKHDPISLVEHIAAVAAAAVTVPNGEIDFSKSVFDQIDPKHLNITAGAIVAHLLACGESITTYDCTDPKYKEN